MEQYFAAAHCLEHEKDDENSNRSRIEMWDRLKKELRDQFWSGNIAWVAREALKKLKHTGSIRKSAKIGDGKKSKGNKKRGGKNVSKTGESSKPKMEGQNTRVRCFICKGSHFASNCPRRENVNTLATMESDNVKDDDIPLQVAPLQFVNVATAKKLDLRHGLFYVEVCVNGRDPVDGLAKAHVKVEMLEGESSFLVVPMQDYDMILVLEFCLETQVSLIPYRNKTIVTDGLRCSYIVGYILTRGEHLMKPQKVSSMQPKDGLGNGMELFLASLMEDVRSDRLMEELVDEIDSMEEVVDGTLPNPMGDVLGSDQDGGLEFLLYLQVLVCSTDKEREGKDV
ncbi:hypothetical protein FEM48_Zijuj07G0001600 [Ziziphus jujuba var. spinosa]|uniref:Uncharacterized protein n=1 Tax=Ziziphus jujuba var. spinosa TaxID=714518 RepID=A0A978V1A7_ZIZJJ|nr:hypothetical protein FEM48_Zijuj07G0001600 [Ziziphus jujuba var. spinosa]